MTAREMTDRIRVGSHRAPPRREPFFYLPEPRELSPEEEAENSVILKLANNKMETVGDLYESVNRLYENAGSFKTAGIMLGGHMIPAFGFTSGGPNAQGRKSLSPDSIDCYFPTAEEAVGAVWALMCMIKINPRIIWTEEAKVDWADHEPISPTKIYWRERPELIVTTNMLYSVRMRAVLL